MTLLLSLLLAGASVAPAPPVPAAETAAPAFDPFVFFNGRSRGEGRLKIAMRAGRLVDVRSEGHREDDTLVLEQRVEQEGEAPRDRTWRLRQVGPGRYAGTLSDAAGPVEGKTEGNRLHLSFRMKGGLKADQWLTLSPDGRSAHNVMKVRKLGIVVATLDETIRRTGA
jgi:hypothetical protein